MPSNDPMREFDKGSECSGFRKVLLKHMLMDGRDCWLTWKADFLNMEILLHVDFLSPALLIEFLESLTMKDDRFGRGRIQGSVEMSKRFNIRVIVATEGMEAVYQLCAYQTMRAHDTSARTEIDLLPLGNLNSSR